MGNLYWDQKAVMKVNNDTSDYKETKRDLRQGCVLSRDLFNVYNETILGELEDIEGVKIGGYTSNNLTYTDDTALIVSSDEDLQRMINVDSEESMKMGLA